MKKYQNQRISGIANCVILLYLSSCQTEKEEGNY